MDLSEWIERYRRAWEQADDEAVGALFTEGATYRSNPFREPYVGRDAIRTYWRQATASQENVRVAFGEPVVQGRRVAVEWWTQMTDEGETLRLVGALILHFDENGFCDALREYYNVVEGEGLPPEGWGR